MLDLEVKLDSQLEKMKMKEEMSAKRRNDDLKAHLDKLQGESLLQSFLIEDSKMRVTSQRDFNNKEILTKISHKEHRIKGIM